MILPWMLTKGEWSPCSICGCAPCPTALDVVGWLFATRAYCWLMLNSLSASTLNTLSAKLIPKVKPELDFSAVGRSFLWGPGLYINGALECTKCQVVYKPHLHHSGSRTFSRPQRFGKTDLFKGFSNRETYLFFILSKEQKTIIVFGEI